MSNIYTRASQAEQSLSKFKFSKDPIGNGKIVLSSVSLSGHTKYTKRYKPMILALARFFRLKIFVPRKNYQSLEFIRFLGRYNNAIAFKEALTSYIRAIETCVHKTKKKEGVHLTQLRNQNRLKYIDIYAKKILLADSKAPHKKHWLFESQLYLEFRKQTYSLMREKKINGSF